MTGPVTRLLVSDLLPLPHGPRRNYNLAFLLARINFQCGEFTNEFMRI